MSDYDVLDARFGALIIGHAKLEKLWSGSRWAEGPVYVPAGRYLLWSDIPNDRVLRFNEMDGHVGVFESACGYQNGHTLDRQGRVVACEHGGRRIARLDHDGVWRAVVERFEGARLNSPNDVIVKSDGTIWFSDPTYGIDSHYEGHMARAEIGGSYVYRHDPARGTTQIVARDLVQPNGLAFSPDESTLYISDTGATHRPSMRSALYAYPVHDGGHTLAERRLLSESPCGLYDGFRVDWHGNIWTSSADSVRALAPDGTLLGRILLPETVSNMAFGGPKRNRLYITAHTSLYALFLNTHECGFPGEAA
ncbi:SMP-30/gluconolactonase/LRE family protein [Gluconacetobacter azotocaptans]|uniref:SMP-30/gluconolactonase/LRE family protein n=1 Tax=Gluconacetobacter azotocaptans TaxID=142834 RepID=A0A7W4JQC8_9PROT|nr:SMP-30/gluconolactonase/LRE family protein [Gluconacetobacter azotocaptans]MBB2189002.1 SMP-30/gluconolactonase/LRE family protein [Gluconacetobacter azotocaptans]MBM9401425.1 SMP-30/gluconolactonase/LRE family protein [Gluconacetobacter azotocaptans]GBQ27612.1 gluconolactonase [Gluconacetobacter azotocaptans DSM 13594]